MDDATRTELEAAAFRALRDHLRARTDVQNIDLMNLAGFCRNCLARWYQEAAAARGIAHRQGGGARDRLRHALRRVGGAAPDRGGPRPTSSPRATEPVRAPEPLTVFVREALAGGGDRAAIAAAARARRLDARPRSRRRSPPGSTPPACRRCRGRAASSRPATPSATG